jgi:predicted component of type VI protein secretion system
LTLLPLDEPDFIALEELLPRLDELLLLLDTLPLLPPNALLRGASAPEEPLLVDEFPPDELELLRPDASRPLPLPPRLLPLPLSPPPSAPTLKPPKTALRPFTTPTTPATTPATTTDFVRISPTRPPLAAHSRSLSRVERHIEQRLGVALPVLDFVCEHLVRER